MMSPNESLSPQQVVAWMRSQAHTFNQMADEIERALGLNGHMPVVESVDPVNPLSRISNILGDEKARRCAQIAVESGIKESRVRSIVEDNPSVFSVNVRGWVSLLEGGESE